MTERDRKVLVVVLALIVLGGFWFLVVHKKQAAIKTAQKAQVTAQTQLATAVASETAAKQLSKVKPTSYAKLVRLGKAIPQNDDFQSLLIQISTITNNAQVVFTSLTAASGSSTGAAAGGPSGVTSCDVTSATGGSAATGASAPAGPTGATASSFVDRDTGKANNAVNQADADAERAAKTQVECSHAPTLTDLTASASGLTPETYTLVFNGNFYNLHTVLKNIYDLTQVHNGKITTDGRLLDISAVSINIAEQGLTATVQLTGYQLPADGTISDSTATTTAPAAATTPAPASGGTP